MGDQELRIKASAHGTEDVARKIDAISDAQNRLAKGRSGSANALAGTIFDVPHADAGKDPVEQQDRLNASTEDYTAILSRIHPLLGGVVDAMFKGSKVAGDLAGKQIDLNAITKKLSSSFAENAGAMKLLGAGGFAAVGFTALASAIAHVSEESRRLREELAKLKDESTEQQQGLIDRQREVVARSSRRREGQFTADEAQGANEILAGIDRRGLVEADEGDNLASLVAAYAGILSGRQIEKLAIGNFEVDLARSPGSRKALAERELRGPNTEQEYQKQVERQHRRRIRERAEATEEAAAGGDVTVGEANLRKRIGETIVHGDLDRVLEIIRKFKELEAEGSRLERFDISSQDRKLRIAATHSQGPFAVFQDAWNGFLTVLFESTQENVNRAAAEMALRRLQSEEKAAASRPAGATGASPSNIDNHTTNHTTYNNARFNGADAHSRRRRSVNGSSRLRDIRRMM